MRHALSCAVISAALAVAGAAAAAPAHGDWSGVYVGADVGATFSQTGFALPGDTDDVLLNTHANDTAFTGGGLIGFNYQVDNFVLGVEGDVSNGPATADATNCSTHGGCFVSTHDSFTTYNRLSTDATERARVRIGWADGRTLFFVAGGYSVAETRLDLIGDCYNAATPTVPTVYTYSRSKTASGYNIGAGVEHAIDRHWIGRLEYIYDGFGDQTYRGDGVEWNDRALSVSTSTVRAAISYKF